MVLIFFQNGVSEVEIEKVLILRNYLRSIKKSDSGNLRTFVFQLQPLHTNYAFSVVCTNY